MSTEKDIRGNRDWNIQVAYQAANTTGGYTFKAPYNAVIKSAVWVPGAAITADGTNYFTLSFFNRGAAGAGTTQWATARAYSATNGAKATPETLTLSGTAANLNVTAGDIINVEVTPAGTGLICPGGAVQLVVWVR